MSITNFGDERQTSFCLYCGGDTDTKEHIPSRIFLDSPYPENLSTVLACKKCNINYSLDEEYVACLIECARVGSAEIASVQRKKIKLALLRNEKLQDRLHKSINISTGIVSIEQERFKRVLVKLAECHCLFEQNEPKLQEAPERFSFGNINDLTEEARLAFETPPEVNKLPEVGSRITQKLLINKDIIFLPWIEVQKGRYRYLVFDGGVRIVFSEYLWCEVVWQE